MSNYKLLLNERPLIFFPQGAKKIGLNEIIVLQQLHFLSDLAAHGMLNAELYSIQDDYIFIGLSIAQWQELYFCFWSEATIKRAFASLRSMDFIVCEKLSEDKTDRTNWYAIDYVSGAWGQNDLMPSGQNDLLLNGTYEIEVNRREIRQLLIAEWEKLQPITPIVADDLEELALEWNTHVTGLHENHKDRGRAAADVVIEAIKETARNADRPNVKYTRAIIKGWIQHGYKVDTRKKRSNGLKEANATIGRGGGVQGV